MKHSNGNARMHIPRLTNVVFLLLVLFTTESAQAQSERRGFIGLSIGPSVPFGSFAKGGWIDPGAGRATSGYSDTFLSLGYRFRERLGVAAALSYGQYDMRGAGDDDWWEVAGVAVGPMYSIPLGRKAALDLKAMLSQIVLTPAVDSYSTDEESTGNLGVDLRAAVRYDVLRRWAVFAEGGAQATTISFNAGRKSYGALSLGFGVAFRPVW